MSSNTPAFLAPLPLAPSRRPRIQRHVPYTNLSNKAANTCLTVAKLESNSTPPRSPQARPRQKPLRQALVAVLAATATFLQPGVRPAAASHQQTTTVARAVPKSSTLNTTKSTFAKQPTSSQSYDPHAAGTPFAIAATSALLASAIAVAVTHPIDTMKTMRQARASGRTTAPISVRTLYRGVGSNIVKEAPNAAIYLAMYEVFKVALLRMPVFAATPLLAMCVAGMLGDAVGSIVRVPAEIVNKRLQLGLSNGWNDAIKDAFLSENGVEGTMASWFAVLWRDVPYGGLQIAGYEFVRLILAGWGMTGLAYSVVAGAVAGLFAAVITTPADVLVTRMSTQSPQCYLETKHYMSPSATFWRIIREEGFGALWTGALERGLFYMPMIGLFFAAYESFKFALLNPFAARGVVMQAVGGGFGGLALVGCGLLTGPFRIPLQLAIMVVSSSLFRRRKHPNEPSVKW